MPKEWIIEALGEDQLLLPGLVGGALTANDGVKYLLTVLQTARTAADGATELTSLREERHASGVDDVRLDRLIANSARESDGSYRIPSAEGLTRRVIREVELMLAPIVAARTPASDGLRERLERVSAVLSPRGDRISDEDVTRLTAGRERDGDSVHLIVMDAHREINALQSRLATDTIAAARVYDLGPGDPGLVRAFIEGVNSTKRLKVDHPGLGAIATRTDVAPVLQNDLGTIDAHMPLVEAEFADAQEFEFTVQDGELFLLQTRTAKRTSWAALQIATDQVHEHLITEEVALSRLEGLDLDEISRFHVDAGEDVRPLARAIPASVGVASGRIALDSEAAATMSSVGSPAVLVREALVTDDVARLALAAGILTQSGGRTSHAAVVARELGKPCLVGCSELELDLTARTVSIGGPLLAEGEVICPDAEAGLVFAGAPPMIEERPDEALDEVACWREACMIAAEAAT